VRRVASRPREGWQRKVEDAGLLWHSGERYHDQGHDQGYWNESACYEFSAQDVERLESATAELEQMSPAAAQHIIEHKLYAKLAIPQSAVALIETSWEAEPPSLYGRFDFAYDGIHPPKLLEYNADTPTSLLEAAVVQWYWLEETAPDCDQFNSIHERLIEHWSELAPYLPERRVDFCSIDDVEDGMTVTYLMDTARQAGLEASLFPIQEIGWDGGSLVGPGEKRLGAVFKLYPWEWMVREPFAAHLSAGGMSDGVSWIEPPWKMLLSNKGILPVLWDLFPGHPNLLQAGFTELPCAEWVRKPLLGREGFNVTIHRADGVVETDGEYGAEGFVYQEAAPLARFDDRYPVIGSWVIGQSPAGVGVRESETPIVTNSSQFVPHLMA
jgi:glutathionylspermidine synthase